MLLELDNVTVRFRNGAVGVRNASVQVAAGVVAALFGPNGAGKTTLVRSIGGFIRAEGAKVVEGRVRFDGQDITNWEPHRVCRIGVSYVPERNKIFRDLTVHENLLALGVLPKGRARQKAFEVVYDMFPILAERRDSIAGRLSGGQQQMLALGRAWLAKPKLLIVDEMTLGLHHSLHPVLFDAVSLMSASGTTVLMVEESTGLALDLAEQCYLMSGGTIRDSGPAEKFRGNELLMAGYVGEAE